MGFVHVTSATITCTALTLVYFAVVTPLALLARLLGRDRLQLRTRGRATYWHALDPTSPHHHERQF